MKTSKLLSTTILVSAAALIAAAPASAAKLKIGGYMEQWIGTAGDGDAAPHNNFDIQNDSEIYFKFKEKLSNGLTVGGAFELEAGTGQTTKYDESSLYVSGSFGKIEIGNNDGAGAVASVKVVGPVGHVKSDRSAWVSMTTAPNDFDIDLGSGDAQQIKYTSPKVNGLQLAVSFKPDSSDGSGMKSRDAASGTDFHDTVAGSITYSGNFGGTKVKLGLGATNNEENSVTQDGYSVGLSLAQGPFAFTFGYAQEEFSSTNEQTFQGAGLIYSLDKVNKISVGYTLGKKKTGTASSDREENITTIGYSRSLGKGVSLQASAFNVDTNHGSGATNVNENGVVGGFRVDF